MAHGRRHVDRTYQRVNSTMKNALLLLAGGMLAIGITAASASAQEVRRVAFTFDDVPATALAHGSCDANRLARFTKTLIEQLVDLEVPATAFVTESRVFLSSAGYEIGVVTIDNQEWVFADVYKHALEDGDAARGERILEAYVDYMNDVFAFFEVWSVDVVGYEPPQVLLLHANELNVRALPKLTAMLQDRGYECWRASHLRRHGA